MSSTMTPDSKSTQHHGPAAGNGQSSASLGGSSRQAAISAVTNYRPTTAPLNFAETPTQELFAANVFSKTVMKERLPKAIFKSLMKTIESGEKLDPSVADVVASAMKDWAIEKGATHYAHVFYPADRADRREARQLPRARRRRRRDRRVQRQDS